MKDSYLISYKLFCSRKKFSLKNFIKNNKDYSYEEVKNYFYQLSVEPPSKEIFNETKKIVLQEMSKSTPSEIKSLPLEEVKNKTEVAAEDTAKSEPPKRRRRRKTKNDKA